MKARRPVSPEEEKTIPDAIDRLVKLQEYPITALEVSYSVDEDHVAEIFVRINSKGTSLNQADFILNKPRREALANRFKDPMVIARVNRMFRDKSGGLMVDYLGLAQ